MPDPKVIFLTICGLSEYGKAAMARGAGARVTEYSVVEQLRPATGGLLRGASRGSLLHCTGSGKIETVP